MSIAYQVQPDEAIGYHRTKRIWEKVDVAVTVPVLLNAYHTLEIGVTAMGKNYTFHPEQHLAELAGELGNLQAWFDSIAGTALTTLTPEFPVLKFQDMHFQSLYADFNAKAHLCPPGYHFSQEFAFDDAHDVVLEMKPEHQVTYGSGALYLIDGQPVPHTFDSAGVRLVSAGKIVRRAQCSNISCLVFKDIGKLSTHPLAGLEIVKLDVTRDWYSTLLLRSPKGLTGRTAAIVIGGIIRWICPRDYINENTIRLSLPNYQLAQQLLEMRDYYDWDDIGIGDLSTPTSVAALRNPETFLALLKHESSFLILIDNPYLELSYVPVNHANSYGVFNLQEPHDPDAKLPLGPLINTFGKIVDYWPTFEEGRWTLETREYARPEWLMSEGRWHKQHKVNDAQPLTGENWRKAEVEMLRIRARVK